MTRLFLIFKGISILKKTLCALLAAVLLFALAACAGSTPAVSATPEAMLLSTSALSTPVTPSAPVPSSAAPVPSSAALVPSSATPAPSTDANLYTVTRVVDGDTIVVDYNGVSEKVRLIGVDAPESVNPNASKNTEAGKLASQFTTAYLTGKQVSLEFDVSTRDQYGRLLAYVWCDGIMFNEYLISQGYAQVATYPPDVKYVDLFTAAQESARENNRGLWGLSEVASFASSLPLSEASPSPTPSSPSLSPSPSPMPSPSPSETPSVSIKLVSISSPVSRGSTAKVSIIGKPNTKYTISVYYSSGASTPAGLDPKTSDANGKVSWSWKIGSRTTQTDHYLVISGGGQSLKVGFTVK